MANITGVVIKDTLNPNFRCRDGKNISCHQSKYRVTTYGHLVMMLGLPPRNKRIVLCGIGTNPRLAFTLASVGQINFSPPDPGSKSEVEKYLDSPRLSSTH
jgi:hypothetical protein